MTVNIIGKLIKFIGKGIEFTFGIQRPIPDIPDSEFPFSVETPLAPSIGSLQAERLQNYMQNCTEKLHCKTALQYSAPLAAHCFNNQQIVKRKV